ncbi:T9SS type A sorting domain-containing protein [Psychroflexus sp. YR1-1]|uniref:T9SS type A sorting domain-containing protein n=1 Tax=Psychroflexus aurantiacus TaxID=2709310 RepID=A0A6B3R5Z0_9FLAO|nr:T9SS-dependent M36 family metallopeptidase [Psychroflexus aurantiacus]NEV94537.1 T9SS type A sorting domain-containing protein [Psychroflexus aurantiacus]
MKSKLLLCLLAFVSFSSIHAQTEIKLIKAYVEQEQAMKKISSDDFSGLKLNSEHFSQSTKLNHIYIQQTYRGIPVFNAIGNFAVFRDEVRYANYDFVTNLASKITTQNSTLTPEEVLQAAATQLGIATPTRVSVIKANSENDLVFSNSGISMDPIPMKLVFYKADQESLKLAWDLSIHLPDGSHWWSMRVDAQNGQILEKNDWIVHCEFDHSSLLGRTSGPLSASKRKPEQVSSVVEGPTYNVFPYPVESPNHGPRQQVTNPADPDFSPFGWHDTDAVEGAEFTITRGNNVYAYEDRASANIAGYSPDGGATLNFDHALDLNQPPAFNLDAAITNLFYWNNIVHDMWAHYGFDERSGNFQQINYTGSGLGDDYVRAEAQDGDGLNNANFGTPPDGARPRMQMFLWSPSGPLEEPLTIGAPETLAGSYDGVAAAFGAKLPTKKISAEFALALDSELSLELLDACEDLTNAAELDQKIVIIKRGNCTFVSKIEKAQAAGALAVIMVNNTAGDPIIMGGEDTGITIPSIMVSQANGEAIIQALQNEESVTGALENKGPYEVDGDFDNGIIAHEYAHGISNRLTGGPSAADCLGNKEQMGEGWSDWVGLMMTISEGDLATQGRGIGTFATSQPVDGRGIRPFQYSTDSSINPATYALTNNLELSEPHGIGFVWATMLWDLNWALIERYGFDSNLYTGTGGNNIAMQLVIDGMKLQACSPGFIDGRDAILEADEFANSGANQCLIWEVFAKRGLGWSAKQGDTDNREDQEEAFNMPPSDILNCSLSNDSFEFDKFGISPNPAKESFKLHLVNTDLSNAKVDIYDMNGRLVISKVSDYNQRVNTQGLTSGMYIVVVASENKTYTKKLIVQ